MLKEKNEIHFGDVFIRILSNSNDLTFSELFLPPGAVDGMHQHLHERLIMLSAVLWTSHVTER